MFTPPPSPVPSKAALGKATDDTNCPDDATIIPDLSTTPLDVRHTTTRRIKWSVLLVPLVVILITLSTRYIIRPYTPPSIWSVRSLSSWTLHRRDFSVVPDVLVVDNNSSSIDFPTSSSATPSGSASAVDPSSTPSQTEQPLPNIPVATPSYPTPFPQPLDTLSQNFSTEGCYDFFLNMTNTDPFRSCRPFSLLSQSSTEFIQAQTNLTLLNNIIFGTCHTTLSQDQCSSNMAWFTSNLQSACVKDLSDKNAMAVQTLAGLQAFDLMRTTGCLADPLTNTYCYLEAVHNPNPSDLYFFQLPLGVGLPNSTTPTCSACTKSLMSLYLEGVPDLDALQATYGRAASIAVQQCGAGYALPQTTIVSAAMGGVRISGTGAWVLLLGLALTSILP